MIRCATCIHMVNHRIGVLRPTWRYQKRFSIEISMEAYATTGCDLTVHTEAIRIRLFTTISDSIFKKIALLAWTMSSFEDIGHLFWPATFTDSLMNDVYNFNRCMILIITCLWKSSTFNVHYLYTLFVKQDSGGDAVKLFWIYDSFQ